MPSGAAPWTLDQFDERFESWVEQSSPEDRLRRVVLVWIMTRYDDPYQGVDREPGFSNLWYGRIPNSGDGCGNVVTCSYFIEESTRTVRCNDIATLAFPA